MIPILCYHRIAELPAEHLHRPYSVTPLAFARQMDYLAGRGYRCVTLADVLATVPEGRYAPFEDGRYPAPLGPRCFALTFDDGTLDCYETALPICEAYGFRPTVFLVSSWLAGQGADGAMGPLLSPAHVLEMRRRGVEFGAHSRTHRPLVELPADELASEVCGCRADLEGLLGEPVTTFAYPYGLSNPGVRSAAAACGYALAVAVANGSDERFHLRRETVGVHDTLLSLAWKVSPWPARLRRLRRRASRSLTPANCQLPIDN